MKNIIPTLDTYVEIPEEIVQKAWDCIDQDEESAFGKVLKAATQYKEAGMTPVFILDQVTMAIYVVAKETFGQRLH